MIVKKIFFNKLSIGKKLEFNRYLMSLNYKVLKGGNHNSILLGFDTEEESKRFMYVFLQQIKKVKGIFGYYDEEGNIHLKYKTKLDFYG